jgi:hypothetical protein
LFRDFGEEEAGVFGSRLATRLAAALYHSQPNSIELAQLNGNVAFVSAYTSKYTPHSMRVSLITAYIMEFGLPLDIVMKVAGHSSIIMSIYYVRPNAEGLRQKFMEGEKRALSQKVRAAIQMIEQNRIDEIRHELISNNEQALELYKGFAYPGSVLFRDYGFCPFAGSRCDDGGPFIGMKKVRQPVPSGYLGCQNCLRCRHFVTGPVFIGGLLALANEISLQSSIQFDQVSKLEDTILDNERQIDLLDEQEYFSSKIGEHFDLGERNGLEMRNRKLRSEAESASKKADMFLTDLQAVSRLINQSQALLNEQIRQEGVEGRHQLIVQKEHELHVAFEEVSKFHQYCEICENAEIYESASAALALVPRSQLIDRMAALNEVAPRMFTLDSKQQLIIGNQLVKFFLHRIKSWDRLDGVIEGRIFLADLAEHEKISRVDIASILDGGANGMCLEGM